MFEGGFYSAPLFTNKFCHKKLENGFLGITYEFTCRHIS